MEFVRVRRGLAKVKTYAEVLEQSLGVLVDLKLARVGVLGEVEGGDLGNILVLALTLLLLQLEGDTADGALLNTLHQVSSIAGDLCSCQLFVAPTIFGFLCMSRYICLSPSQGAARITLLRSLLDAMMATSSQIRLLVSKSRVSLG